MLSRSCFAVALLCFAACSFPDYRGPGDGSGAAPSGGTGALHPSCQDGSRNGDETGVDCGGSCNPCPVCSDGVLNGDETGVDCGGSCEPCPRCDDGVQNGAESDVDCGGTCAIRCATNQRCREAADCESLVCDSVCQPSDCNDHVRNGHETGTDCGGDCPSCGNGSACESDGDCQSQHCQGGVCVASGCTDGILNGSESDTDCGGNDCAPCAAGKKCQQPNDCDSALCAGDGTCSAASCSDATQNQHESGADCGGPCAACGLGLGCFKAEDCESGLCRSGTCVPEYPTGQPLSRVKWMLSSSEGTGSTDPSLAFDGDTASCWTSGTPQHSGMYVDLDLGERQIFFKALLQTTQAPYDQDFPISVDAYVSSDGTFGDPVVTGVMGGSWTWVDFGAAQVGRYVRFELTAASTHAWSIGEVNLYN